MTLAAVAAIAAAAATAVVALAFALYAIMVPIVGQAGAAGTVALTAAILVLAAGLIAAAKARGRIHHHEAAPDRGVIDIILNLVRERPLVSAGAAVAAAIFAMRNPAFVAALVRAFVDQRPNPPKD